jgi:hypothetical protein
MSKNKESFYKNIEKYNFIVHNFLTIFSAAIQNLLLSKFFSAAKKHFLEELKIGHL